MTLSVNLEWYEMASAAQVGLSRHLEQVRAGKYRPLPSGCPWDTDVEGALGEQAFAKATGRYWSHSVNTFKNGGDVGDIQIRTRSKEGYELFVNPTDRDEDIFVLVVGKHGKYKIEGWMYGRDAKQEHWLRTLTPRSRPAYFVPTPRLNDPSVLVTAEE